MTIYLGIDPGKTGAIAAMDAQANVVYCADTPEIRYISLALIEIYKISSDIKGAIEHVHAMPGQGVSSMFTFGSMFGAAQATLATLKIPYLLVQPREWQKRVVPPVEDRKARKEASRRVAIQRYGNSEEYLKRKKDDGRADAMHLADYARRYYSTT